MNSLNCKNCNQEIIGSYCHHCGEKVVAREDFSIKTLFGQLIDGLFNIDSKAIRSFRLLLFKPGKLTKKYVEGVRQPYMKPIQIFLITNVLFFFLLTQADIFRIPATYYFTDARASELRELMERNDQSESEIGQRFDNLSSNISKAAIILTLPFLALLLLILYYRSNMLYGMHLIFSMHYLSFFFISCLLAVLVATFGNRIVQLFIITLNIVYVVFAIHKFYRSPWVASIAKSLVINFGFVGIAILYRWLTSFISYQILLF